MAKKNYQTSLSTLLELLGFQARDIDAIVTGLVVDSRRISNGDLFIAYPGAESDGRDYIAQAQAAGAVAVLYEADGYKLPEDITIPAYAITGLQMQVGYLAHHFYQQPSKELQVFGVTGTNGKTTCAYLLTQAFDALELNAAFIGTIGRGRLSALEENKYTTPGPVTVHRMLAEYRDQGITQVCMEVSSHALDQGRVSGVEFFCTLFTNLSHDHLDYHGDMAAYAAVKQRLFSQHHSELTITNADDALGAQLIDVADAEFIVSYTSNPDAQADVRADEVRLTQNGIELYIEANGVDFELQSPLIGQVNVPNIMLLTATLLALSTDVNDIQRVVAKLAPAPGRMELHTHANKPHVVIDYAHTPDALEKALRSIRAHCDGALWCVFGCGGDRDSAKRPLMGAAAENNADYIVVSNDNPRSESAQTIAEEITAGMSGAASIELDRAQAIRNTITKAKSDDWVLVAGKGHETTQEIQGVKHAFSDREQVLAALSAGQGEAA